MEYQPGQRVKSPDITDDEITQKISEFSNLDYESILGEGTPDEQLDARLYLQIWYEKFLRGESTRSILTKENRDNKEEEALQSFERLKDELYTPFVDLINESHKLNKNGSPSSDTFEITCLKALTHAEELLDIHEEKRWRVMCIEIIIRTIFHSSRYKNEFARARIIGNELIVTLGQRLSYFFSNRMRAIMRHKIDIEPGDTEASPETKALWALPSPENRAFDEMKGHPRFKRDKRIFEIIAYNTLLLLIEHDWLKIKMGNFDDFLVTTGRTEEDITKKVISYPNILVFSDFLYTLIHKPSEESQDWNEEEWREYFETRGGINNHPLVKYFTTDRDRWLYTQPIDHRWDEEPPPNIDIVNDSKDELHEDVIFSREQSTFEGERIPGEAIAGGFLTPPRPSAEEGYHRLRKVVSNLDEFANLGVKADATAPWYENSPRVGRKRGIANKQSIDALNHLQKTQWEINLELVAAISTVIKKDGNKFSRAEISSNHSKISDYLKEIKKIELINCYYIKKIDKKDEKICFSCREPIKENGEGHQEKAKDSLQCKNFGKPPGIQLPGDIESRKKWIDVILNDWVPKILSLNGNVFWHVWACDWRGRLMPRCTFLSPQESDFDRGLIRFKEWKPLGEEGWKWLRVHTFNLTAGMILTSSETHLKKTSFDERAELVLKNIEKFRKIADDPIKHLDQWQESPRPKGDSMQRLAAILEVVRVYDEHKKQGGKPSDWEKVKSGLPIQLDASTNVYQHLSALLRNDKLAEKVNVLPKPMVDSEDSPDCPESDLYLLVVKEAKRAYNSYEKNGEHQSLCSELFRQPNLQEIFTEDVIDEIFSRKFSKNITMTLAYGSRDYKGKFMGNKNGDPGYMRRKHVYCGDDNDVYKCSLDDCQQEFPLSSKNSIYDHIFNEHKQSFDRDKHIIRLVTMEEIPSSQQSGKGVLGFEENTPEKHILHIRNLNNRKKSKAPPGTKENPYKLYGKKPDNLLTKSPKRNRVYFVRRVETNEEDLEECDDQLWCFDCSWWPDKKTSKRGSQERQKEIKAATYVEPHCTSSWIPIWHEKSLLYELLRDQDIPPKLQSTIAYYVGEDYKNAVETATSGANKLVEDELKKVVEESPENIVAWTTPTGFRVLNYYPHKIGDPRFGSGHGGVWTNYWGKKYSGDENPWPTIPQLFERIIEIKPDFSFDDLIRRSFTKFRKGEKDTTVLENIFLSIQVPSDDLQKYLDKPYTAAKEAGDEMLDELLNTLDGGGTFSDKVTSRPLLFEINRQMTRIDPENASTQVQYVKLHREMIKRTTYTPSRLADNIPKPRGGPIPHDEDEDSYTEMNESKKKSRTKVVNDMKRGITPNFVQSLDGAHMTMVVNSICDAVPNCDFWAVHDCFGVHAGDTDRLVTTVESTFRKIHSKPLSKWMKEIDSNHDISNIPKPSGPLKDPISEWNISDYLIS